MDRFEAFKQKEKFLEEPENFYTGIADENMRPVLSQKLNQAADDFNLLSKDPNSTVASYHQMMAIALERFEGIYLDTEDRERLCHYFEELMDMVGLESSGGLLNTFLYGFNPDDFKK